MLGGVHRRAVGSAVVVRFTVIAILHSVQSVQEKQCLSERRGGRLSGRGHLYSTLDTDSVRGNFLKL